MTSYRETQIALKKYCDLPDPPEPGREEWQLAELRSTVKMVTDYLKQHPTRGVKLQIELLLNPYLPRDEYVDDADYQRALIKYDVARSILDTAANRI